MNKHSSVVEINGQPLAPEIIEQAARNEINYLLSEAARERINAARHVVESVIRNGQVVYGINTGFGKLADISVSASELQRLQLNLVRSHACGVGENLTGEEVRVMMLLRANVLAKGMSGARVEVVELLLAMLDKDVVPCVPSKGSVGASGDLAPLAHLALVLVGEGLAVYENETLNGAEALRRAGLAPVTLEAKEGLALLNGTQAMAAVGMLALVRAERAARALDVACAMTLEALLGTPAAYDERIHAARAHQGQIEVARRLRLLIENSEIRDSHLIDDKRVQDAYSLRCAPQVHGAARDAVSYARRVVEIETGSATDNPLIFAESQEIISGGNFHGAPLGLAFDFAAIALTDLAGISERRIERLVNPDLNEGLPAFLAARAGTESGLMLAQVTAVALLAEMKVSAHPASVDNVPTSAGKEDHVSMGMTAALKLKQIVENLEIITSIELLCAAEGIEYRRPLKSGVRLEEAHARVRRRVPRITADRVFADDIKSLQTAVRQGFLDDIV